MARVKGIVMPVLHSEVRGKVQVRVMSVDTKGDLNPQAMNVDPRGVCLSPGLGAG